MDNNISKLSASQDTKITYPAVILVIDAQVDFLSPTAPFPCINAENVVANIRKVIDVARKTNLPVIYTREVHHMNGLDFGFELEAGGELHCVEGTPGVEIVKDLKPLPGEFVIDKRRYNAFLGTHMDLVLNTYGHPTLLITGFTTNVCVYCTAVEAWQRDYPVRVICDCVSGTSEERHQSALKMLNYLSKKIVINLEEFLITYSNR